MFERYTSEAMAEEVSILISSAEYTWLKASIVTMVTKKEAGSSRLALRAKNVPKLIFDFLFCSKVVSI